MKAAIKHYRHEWEEAQWLRLTEIVKLALHFTFNFVKLFANLTLFITYITLRWAWNLAKLALLSQPYNQMIRDEPWIYRQIK